MRVNLAGVLLLGNMASKGEDSGPFFCGHIAAPGPQDGPRPDDPQSHPFADKDGDMAEITAQMVKELREKSGAGMMDCKKALTEADGDMEKAMTLLRERGAAIASKRSSRVAKEGVIAAQISPDRKRGALVELNSESDFVARNEEFRKLVQDLADHAITLADPSTMLESRMPSGETVADVVKLLVGKIGENIILSRWQVLECSDKGYCFSYVHPPGKIGVLVEVETSMPGLADNPEFRDFARDIAMHIAATAPTCVRREEVPADMLEKEREIYRHQARNERKPENVVEKIFEAKTKHPGDIYYVIPGTAHADLPLGLNAPSDVFPKIGDWLDQQCATSTSGAASEDSSTKGSNSQAAGGGSGSGDSSHGMCFISSASIR